MRIVAVGLSHRTAPVELRERLAFAPGELPGALARLAAVPDVREVALLSTCNRTEVYAVCTDPAPAAAGLVAAVAELKGLDSGPLLPYLYQYADTDAARHLFRVAAGLDSMVLGETQILGQVRDAYQAAVAAGTVGKILHQLLSQALAAGKRAQTETGIGSLAVSVSYAAVELARKVFHSLQGRTVMAIGAGETAKLTVRHLQGAGAGRILIANRTLARAQRLAAQVGGTPLALTDLPAHLPQADVVIASTGAPGYVLGPQEVAAALRQRRGRPMLIIDIAVPRDVDPAVGQLEGAFLYNIDDLQQVVAANLQERAREAERAERILQEEVARFQGWLRALEVVPTIRLLREKVDAIRRAELQRALAKLPHLGERERQVIEAMTVAIVNKILNDPTQRLKDLAEEGKGGMAAAAVQRLFDLPPVEGERQAASGR